MLAQKYFRLTKGSHRYKDDGTVIFMPISISFIRGTNITNAIVNVATAYPTVKNPSIDAFTWKEVTKADVDSVFGKDCDLVFDEEYSTTQN
jgi:hypothetical protein